MRRICGVVRAAIMQPYLFPYYLYWSLIQQVDIFVVFDNVNFKKKGFINRNYSFNDGTKKRFTLELQKSSQNKLISEIDICTDQGKLLFFFKSQYKCCPYFDQVFPFLEDILSFRDGNLTSFLSNSIQKICDYLDIRTNIILASSLQTQYHDLKGQEKILSICNLLGANEYLNLPGGRNLYDKSEFNMRNIDLSFVAPYDSDSVSNMVNNFQECTIVDLMMNVPQKKLINFFNMPKK